MKVVACSVPSPLTTSLTAPCLLVGDNEEDKPRLFANAISSGILIPA
jgi:hypothetical protein